MWLCDKWSRGVAAARVYIPDALEWHFPNETTLIKVSYESLDHSYEPGQYFFVNIPDISLNEWHPFTASAVLDDGILFCIKRMNSKRITSRSTWTQRLADRAIGQHNDGTGPEQESGASTSLAIRLCGPYGYSDFTHYERLLLVAGGIGITPMIAIFYHLKKKQLLNQSVGNLKYVHLVWMSRSVGEFRLFEQIFSLLTRDSRKAAVNAKHESFQDPINETDLIDLLKFSNVSGAKEGSSASQDAHEPPPPVTSSGLSRNNFVDGSEEAMDGLGKGDSRGNIDQVSDGVQTAVETIAQVVGADRVASKKETQTEHSVEESSGSSQPLPAHLHNNPTPSVNAHKPIPSIEGRTVLKANLKATLEELSAEVATEGGDQHSHGPRFGAPGHTVINDDERECQTEHRIQSTMPQQQDRDFGKVTPSACIFVPPAEPTQLQESLASGYEKQRSSLHSIGTQVLTLTCEFQLGLFCTKRESFVSLTDPDSVDYVRLFIHSGRCNLAEAFEHADMAGPDCAVAVCGPPSLMLDVSMLSAQRGCDFHTEQFLF